MTSPSGAERRPLASSTPFPNYHRASQRQLLGTLEISSSSDKGPDKPRPAVIGVSITGPLKHQYESVLRQVKGVIASAGIKTQFQARDTNLVTLMTFDMSLNDRNTLFDGLAIGETVTLTLDNVATTQDSKIVCRVSLPPEDQILPMLSDIVTDRGGEPMIVDGLLLGSYDGPIKPAQHRVMEKCLQLITVTVRIPMHAILWQRPDGSEVATLQKQMTKGTFMSSVKASEWAAYRKETWPIKLDHFLGLYSDSDEQQSEAKRETLQQVLQHDFREGQTVQELATGAFRLMGLQVVETPVRQVLALTTAALPRYLEMHGLSQKLLQLWAKCTPKTFVEIATQSGLPLREFVTQIHLSRATDEGYDRAQQALRVMESARALTQVNLDGSAFSSVGNQTADPTDQRTLAQAVEEMLNGLRHKKGYTTQLSDDEDENLDDDGWGKGLTWDARNDGGNKNHSRTGLFTTAHDDTEEFLPEPVPIPEGTLSQLDPNWFHVRFGQGPIDFPSTWLAYGAKMRRAGQYTRYFDAIAATNHLPDYQFRSVVCFLWSAVEQMQHLLDEDKVRQWKEQVTEVSEEDRDWVPTVKPPGVTTAPTTMSQPQAQQPTDSIASPSTADPSLTDSPGRGRASSPANSERRQPGWKASQLNNQAAGRQAQRLKDLESKTPGKGVTFQEQQDSSDIYSDQQ